LFKFGFQGKAVGTPRNRNRRGRTFRSKLASFIRESLDSSPVEKVATAKFLTAGGDDGVTITSVNENGDNYLIAIQKESVFIPPFTTYIDYYFNVWNPSRVSVYSGNEATLAALITSAQNAGALRGILSISLADGVTDVVYNGVYVQGATRVM
jgi:hypothetical protein